jgi:hypothetical protein
MFSVSQQQEKIDDRFVFSLATNADVVIDCDTD